MARRSSSKSRVIPAPASSSQKSSTQTNQARALGSAATARASARPPNAGPAEAGTPNKGNTSPRPSPQSGEGEDRTQGPRWVSSYEALGELFGLHRGSFSRLVKRLNEEGIDCPTARANGDHSVPDWEEFFEEHPEIKRSADSSKRSELLNAIEEERLRKLRFANDLNDKLYLPRAEVEAWLVNKVQQVRDRLTSKLKNELPPKLAGLGAAAIAAKMDREISDICRLLQGAIGSK